MKKSKIYIGKSPVMHSYTSGGDKTISNAKSITITNREVKKGKVTIAKGKASAPSMSMPIMASTMP